MSSTGSAQTSAVPSFIAPHHISYGPAYIPYNPVQGCTAPFAVIQIPGEPVIKASQSIKGTCVRLYRTDPSVQALRAVADHRHKLEAMGRSTADLPRVTPRTAKQLVETPMLIHPRIAALRALTFDREVKRETYVRGTQEDAYLYQTGTLAELRAWREAKRAAACRPVGPSAVLERVVKRRADGQLLAAQTFEALRPRLPSWELRLPESEARRRAAVDKKQAALEARESKRAWMRAMVLHHAEQRGLVCAGKARSQGLGRSGVWTPMDSSSLTYECQSIRANELREEARRAKGRAVVYVKSDVALLSMESNEEAPAEDAVDFERFKAKKRPAKRRAERDGQENVPVKRRITTWI